MVLRNFVQENYHRNKLVRQKNIKLPNKIAKYQNNLIFKYIILFK